MGLRKESEKALSMEKKEIPLQKKTSELQPRTTNEIITKSTSFKKESEKALSMEKKEIPLRKESSDLLFESEESLKSELKNELKQGLKTGVKKYKEELEQGDLGVKSAGQAIDKGHETIKVINKVRKNRKENQVKKESEEQLKKLQKKLNKESDFLDIKKTTNKLNEKNKFIKKAIQQPKKMTKKGVKSYATKLQQGDDGVKTGIQGLKIAKESVKKINQVKKNKKQDPISNTKLKEPRTKLYTQSKINKVNTKELKKPQKTLLRKKMIRTNIEKNRQGKRATKSVGRTAIKTTKKGFNKIKKVALTQLKKLSSGKIALGIGAVFLKLLPVFLIIGAIFAIILVFAGMGKEDDENYVLSSDVEQWRSLVTEIANEKGMSDYIDLILAIIQVESGGTGTRDIMQSSESAGYPRNHFQTERESVEQGVSYLKRAVDSLSKHNRSYLEDYKLIAQTYNFGLGFAGYTHRQGAKGYDIDVAETYSRDVVAYSLGNTTGETYTYKNELSKRLGKTYLYRNGGNFMYGELVAQYIVTYGDGEIAPPVTPMIVTSHFGYRISPGGIGSSNHKGIDLGCVNGVTPISSILDGVVHTSQYVNGYGNTVIVKHNESLYSLYAHMSKLSVQKGNKVKAGQQIGICGSTGNSTGPHLHLEISPEPYKNQVNPYPYLKHLIN